METYGFYLISLLIQVATAMDFSTTLKGLILICATYSAAVDQDEGENFKKRKIQAKSMISFKNK